MKRKVLESKLPSKYHETNLKFNRKDLTNIRRSLKEKTNRDPRK